MQKNDIYKCSVCGNIVSVSVVGGGELVCCAQPMQDLPEQTADMSLEKHVPMVEEIANGVRVFVGSTEHPMEESHYIEWIEVLTTDGKVYRKYLNPGQKPEAEFCIAKEDIAKVREHCNLHGLWKA